MKYSIVSLIILYSNVLFSHGFSANTLVQLADSSWQQISTICHQTLKKKVSIASYNTTSSAYYNALVKCGGRSKTSCYIRFTFEKCSKESHHNKDEITCTPTQEFYLTSTQQWVSAYILQVGDRLLCANSVAVVSSIELIQDPIAVYTLEIKGTHTFFVTYHSVLTHNMLIPFALNVCLSIPFGVSAGGAAGSFFGPATFAVGTVIGCMVGAIVQIVCGDKIPRYTIDAYDVNKFDHYMHQQIVQHQSNNNLSDQCITTTSISMRKNNTITYITSGTADDSEDSVQLYTTHNENSDTGCSVSIAVTIPEQKIIGCGDTTPQQPLILVTPAEPMRVFQNSGFRPLSDEERKLLSGGCTIIPITTSEKGSNILSVAEKTAEEVISIINDLKKSAKPGEKTKGKTEPYIIDGTYDDAVKKFNELIPKNVKEISSNDGKAGLVGDLADGRNANVRTDSSYKTPTLEIYNASNGKKLKFRYTPS